MTNTTASTSQWNGAQLAQARSPAQDDCVTLSEAPDADTVLQQAVQCVV